MDLSLTYLNSHRDEWTESFLSDHLHDIANANYGIHGRNTIAYFARILSPEWEGVDLTDSTPAFSKGTFEASSRSRLIEPFSKIIEQMEIDSVAGELREFIDPENALRGLAMLVLYGQDQGDHHRQWAIDQCFQVAADQRYPSFRSYLSEQDEYLYPWEGSAP